MQACRAMSGVYYFGIIMSILNGCPPFSFSFLIIFALLDSGSFNRCSNTFNSPEAEATHFIFVNNLTLKRRKIFEKIFQHIFMYDFEIYFYFSFLSLLFYV
jgi:hypothetical protein